MRAFLAFFYRLTYSLGCVIHVMDILYVTYLDVYQTSCYPWLRENHLLLDDVEGA
jgi:hypothetical protein